MRAFFVAAPDVGQHDRFDVDGANAAFFDPAVGRGSNAGPRPEKIPIAVNPLRQPRPVLEHRLVVLGVRLHLAEERRLTDADGRWLPQVQIGEIEVPETIRLVLGRRIDRIENTLDVLRLDIGESSPERLEIEIGDTCIAQTLERGLIVGKVSVGKIRSGLPEGGKLTGPLAVPPPNPPDVSMPSVT